MNKKQLKPIWIWDFSFGHKMLLKHFKVFHCPVLLISVYQCTGKTKTIVAGKDCNTNANTNQSKLFSGEN